MEYRTMTFKDYDKAASLLANWHHARAMECLRALNDSQDLTEDEHKEIHDDYKFHRATEDTLYRATLAAIGSFYSA